MSTYTRGRSLLAGSVIAAVSAFAGCAVGNASSSDAPTTAVSAPASTITHTETVYAPAPTLDQAPAPLPDEPQAAAGPLTEFGDGTWEIGVDIVPGKYKSAGPDNGGVCFAQTEKEGNDALGDIAKQDVSQGPMTFTIPAKGVKIFKTNGCQTWKKV